MFVLLFLLYIRARNFAPGGALHVQTGRDRSLPRPGPRSLRMSRNSKGCPRGQLFDPSLMANWYTSGICILWLLSTVISTYLNSEGQKTSCKCIQINLPWATSKVRTTTFSKSLNRFFTQQPWTSTLPFQERITSRRLFSKKMIFGCDKVRPP